MFPEPIVELSGSHLVDVSVNRIGGKLAINLVNTAGPHADRQVPIFSEIPPIGPLTVTLRTGRKPARVTWEPDGETLPFDYHSGEAKVVIAKLGVHGVILVQ